MFNFTFKENIILSVVNNDHDKSIMPCSMLKKIEALNNTVDDSDYQELFANAKRVANILKKSDLHLSLDINENLTTAIITPDKEIVDNANMLSPAYLIFDNYELILKWNRSLRFALAVCTLKNKFTNEL